MKKINNILVFSVLSLFMISTLTAQRNFTLYEFQNTHQSLHLNPAFRPNIQIYTSAGLGYASFSANHTGFALGDLLVPRAMDDSLVFDVANALSKMSDLNRINFDIQNELFGFGIRLNQTHLMFSTVLKNQFDLFYPKDLFRFAFEGNGASLLGQRADLDGLGFRLNAYMEYAFGANTLLLDDKLSVGGRVKLLSGLYNAQTTRSELGIYTSDSTFDITIDGAMSVNTSFLNPILDRNYFSGFGNGFNFRNVGLGFDFGAQYEINDRFDVSASVIDLGFINWNSNNRNFESEEVNFTFQGIDLNQLLADSANYFNAFADSLQGLLNTKENNDAYRNPLNTRFFVGGRMKVSEVAYVNALWYNEFVLGKYTPGVLLGGTFQLKDWLTVSSNYVLFGRFSQNLGVGFNLRFGAFQFFTMTDNLFGVLRLSKSQNWHLNIGMSASIGKPDNDKAKR